MLIITSIYDSCVTQTVVNHGDIQGCKWGHSHGQIMMYLDLDLYFIGWYWRFSKDLEIQCLCFDIHGKPFQTHIFMKESFS